MVKIRVQGTPAEISKFLYHIESDDDIVVLEQSALYPNRGKSEYGRVYLDVTLDKTLLPAAGI